MQKIQQSGQHLLGIINDILDFSKIEAGKLSIENIDFDLDKVLENVGNLMTREGPRQGAGADLRGRAARSPPHLRGDPLRLGQILINFCNNAVKFTETRRDRASEFAFWRIAADCELVRFSVSDTGIGMTEEQIGRLFQAFSRPTPRPPASTAAPASAWRSPSSSPS